MMNYYGYRPMMWGGGSVFGLLVLLTWLVWLAVGVLLIVWLYKKVKE